MKPSPHQLASPQDQPPTTRCYWVLKDRFLAGAYPGAAEQSAHLKRIDTLWQAGLRTFLNLMEEDETNQTGKPFTRYDDRLRELAAQGGMPMAHLRFPVVDGSIPTRGRMQSVLDAIDLSLAAGRPVYLHCFGGMGRTGTAVCCWLVRHGLVSAEEAVTRLQQLRQADELRRDWPAPENQQQTKFVRGWQHAE